MALLTLAGLLFAALLAPRAILAFLCLWAVATLIGGSALKLAAAIAVARGRRLPDAVPGDPVPARPPVVSLLVPLYREPEVAALLVERLARLDYPPDRLDICLILEQDDALTRAAVAAAELPAGVQVIEVPAGSVRTKPRALNYALAFAKGSIIGIYDAEDMPDPDQIRRVTRQFARSGSELACIQGVLDYYNTGVNWIARCFTLEYAVWFRVMLPGLARLGLAVPLGGTTLFLRRAAIEAVGGWDAHNVTEDADLGLRLARAGYRTELIDSVTGEEANARAWPWVKQRTRWLKGYALTWAVHMRDPAALWRDLGPRGFWGVQGVFFCTLSQFLLAPVLWSFWLLPLGLGHPLQAILGSAGLWALGGLFLAAEILSLTVAVWAARLAGKPWLAPWALTLPAYFPMATVAAWRALADILRRPFHWEKTAHGIYRPAPTPPPRPVPHQA